MGQPLIRLMLARTKLMYLTRALIATLAANISHLTPTIAFLLAKRSLEDCNKATMLRGDGSDISGAVEGHLKAMAKKLKK